MKTNKVIFLLLLLILLNSIVGCIPNNTAVAVPGPEVTLAKATDIDLKVLDLTKITKKDAQDILGYSLENIVGAKTIEYRYPKKPIVVKIAKFQDVDKAEFYWKGLKEYIKAKEPSIGKGAQEFKEENHIQFKHMDQEVILWQEDLWLVCIEVPNELKNSEELGLKVQQLIKYHFNNLE